MFFVSQTFNTLEQSVRYSVCVCVKCENWTTTLGELLQVQYYSSDFKTLQSNYDTWSSYILNVCLQAVQLSTI